MSKRIVTTLLFMVVIAIVALFTHTVASARVCVFKIGGTCVIWTGSVEAVLTADELGDYIKQPKSLGFTIHPLDPKKDIILGHLYCVDPDSTERKIIPDAEFSGEFGHSVTIKEGDIYQCKTETAIVAAVAELNDTELRDLDKRYCQEPNLDAIDFVPYEFYTTIALEDEESKNVLDKVRYKCALPEYKTLGWDKNRPRPERRQYDCELIK